MSSKTFYLDRATGAIMICDFDPNYDFAAILANHTNHFDKLAFHTDFDFIQIRETVAKSSITFSGVTRASQTWSSGGCGCFITTACCEHRSLPDDCHELTSLRQFRDQWMLTTEDGRDMVKEYYTWAPCIVKALEVHPQKDSVYETLFNRFIKPAVDFLDAGKPEMCFEIYRQGYQFAREQANAHGLFANTGR